MTSPGITLCMIVKNEVANLADALASVAGIVDQVLIGDTGSTDGTQALAASLGATVIDVPWTDDFAAARNAVLAHAEHAWIFYFDADERLTERGRQWLAQDLPPAGTDAFRGVFHSRATRLGFDRLCLFPNGLGIRWSRRLHEWPTWPDGRSVEGLVIPALSFDHVGDQRPKATEVGKHERYLAIEQGILAANPDSQVDRYYVAMSQLALQRYEDAYATFLAAWDNPAWRAQWRPGALAWQLADAAKLAGDWPRWRDWATCCVADVPTFVMGWELLVKGLHKYEGMPACKDAAKQWFAACRSGEHWAEAALGSHPDMLDEAWRFHVWAQLATGSLEEGRHWAYHAGAPADLAVHADLVVGEVERAVRLYCSGLPNPDRALAIWMGWLQEPSPVPDLLPAMIWASLRCSHYGDLAVTRFAEVIAAFPESSAPRLRRAHFWLQRQSAPQIALADLRWITAREPNHAEAWKLLAIAAERCGLDGEAAIARSRFSSKG